MPATTNRSVPVADGSKAGAGTAAAARSFQGRAAHLRETFFEFSAIRAFRRPASHALHGSAKSVAP
jgi:hypothetical protein